MSDHLRFRSAAGFRQAVDDRLKTLAKDLGSPTTLGLLRRRFLHERFLARVFSGPDEHWALKGGVGMLVRVPPLARYSRDIDLQHLSANVDEAVAELREIARLDLGDFLRFQVGEPQRVSTDEGFRIKIEALVGVTTWDTFPVDVSCELHYVGELEHRNHAPVLPADKLNLPLPEFVLYPGADQVADKVAAMYERHGADQQAASNRWRDLADLVLLIEVEPLDAATLRQALLARVAQARNPVRLPDEMRTPGPEWERGYPTFAAKETLIPERYHDLRTALRCVGECLDPILGGTLTTGRWSPSDRRWAGGEVSWTGDRGGGRGIRPLRSE